MLGGVCRVIDDGGLAKGLEITFSGQPVTYAPAVKELSEGPAKIEIIGRDDQWLSLKRHLDQTAAFLGCYYDIHLATNEIEAQYEGETPDEENIIDVKSFSRSVKEQILPIRFDMLTRANMAAEKYAGPTFEATLLATATSALDDQRFIDSFRYSFLLIESLFGDGQFKKAGLSKALKGNPEFVAIVKSALADPIRPKSSHQSKMATFLRSAPSEIDVIDCLVEQRGFYFHGNVKRRNGWKPDVQEEAEALAAFSIGVAQLCAVKAAAPIFSPEFGQRHFDEAVSAGASIVFEVQFKFREQDQSFDQHGQINIQTPGTKVTCRQANSIAQRFLSQFEYESPIGELLSARCNVKGTEQPVFDMTFHIAGGLPEKESK